MKIRNKKTGDISTNPLISVAPFTGGVRGCHIKTYRSAAEFNEEWEDVEDTNVTSMPLIKDEKIRKAVRAWAEANNINPNHYYDTDVVFDSVEHCLTWIDTSIQFNEITGLENLEDGKKYTIDELCGDNL